MAKPVILVVDDEDASLEALARELDSRYGAHYLVVPCASPGQALTRLAELRAEGASVPLVLADQWMPERTGAEFLAQVRDLYPTARRVLLISWGDQAAAAPIADAAALGQRHHKPRPAKGPSVTAPAATSTRRAGPPCHPGSVAMTALAIAVSEFGTSRASMRLRIGPPRTLRSNVLR